MSEEKYYLLLEKKDLQFSYILMVNLILLGILRISSNVRNLTNLVPVISMTQKVFSNFEFEGKTLTEISKKNQILSLENNGNVNTIFINF